MCLFIDWFLGHFLWRLLTADGHSVVLRLCVTFCALHASFFSCKYSFPIHCSMSVHCLKSLSSLLVCSKTANASSLFCIFISPLKTNRKYHNVDEMKAQVIGIDSDLESRLLIRLCVSVCAGYGHIIVRWWHTTVSMTDHQCTSATSVHRSSPFPFVLGLALLTTMAWLYHVLGPRVMVRAVSASRHPRFGTVVLVANSSSRALRLGSLCKPTHKRRPWERCLSGALQILDLIDWLIDWDLIDSSQWRRIIFGHISIK